MTDVESETGLSVAYPEQVREIAAAQLGVQNLRAPPVGSPKSKDKIYKSNLALWDALLSERIRTTAVVTLKDFWLSEWFPLRPGLFHTPRGRANRLKAERYRLTGPGVSGDGLRQFQMLFGRNVPPQILERFQLRSSLVYDPYGKSFMLDGGVGCVRLKRKEIPEGRVWFMGASSSPIAHEGIPVALPDELYAKFIEWIASKGSIRCSITGKLTQIPEDFDPLYRDLVGIPQVYVLAAKLQPLTSARDAAFLATGAVTIEARSRAGERAQDDARYLRAGLYGAYVSFLPGKPNAIMKAAEWLQEIYVHQLLGGRVITDFDEQVRRFDGTVFSLEQIMDGNIPRTDAELLLSNYRAPRFEVNQFIEKIEIVNGDAWNVVGDANVIASPGSAAATSGGAAAASGGAAATQGASAISRHSASEANVVQRAKDSRWVKVSGIIALAATVLATVLLALNVTDIGIASYILAVVAIAVGVIPLFSKVKPS